MPAKHTVIDHLVVTAPDLDTGAAYVKACLGVVPEPGGAHPKMRTHNRLLRCGPDCYLEVMAIDPKAPSPIQPRWFGLDTLASDGVASLSAWVVRSPAIDQHAAASPQPLGAVTAMQRAHLNWLITIPETGIAPLNGLAPALIEWQTAQLPVLSMPDLGLSLEALHIYHPQPQQMQALLAALALQAPVSVFPAEAGTSPTLRAIINTPTGQRTIG